MHWFENEESIKRFVISLIGIQDSNDLYHDVYMRAWRARNQLRDESKFRAWVFQIAKNKAKNMYRSRDRTVACDFQTLDTLIQSYDDPGMDIDTLFTMEIIDGLPVDLKRMIYLHVFFDMTIREIAVVTKTSYYVVKDRIKKAKYLLNQKLAEQNSVPEVFSYEEN